MREIKFRGSGAWGWVEGFLFMREGHDPVIYPTDRSERAVTVLPTTIGQYTGLKDKNGTEIYESDICVDARGFKFVAEWDDDNARFLGRGNGYIRYIGQEPAVTVIGNIHDDPHLIAQEE